MTAQIACLWSNFLGDGSENNGYRPRFIEGVNEQSGEKWAWNLVDLVNTLRATIPNLPSAELVEKHSVTVAGFEPRIGIVYVYADHTRINTAAGNANYYVAWRYTVNRLDPIAASDPLPTQNSQSAEATAILAWLSAQTGKTTTQITTWLRGKFGVATNQAALNWITGNPRSALMSKLAEAFQIWANANSEIV